MMSLTFWAAAAAKFELPSPNRHSNAMILCHYAFSKGSSSVGFPLMSVYCSRRVVFTMATGYLHFLSQSRSLVMDFFDSSLAKLLLYS